MLRYVLTGTPGSGKTAILRHLEHDGFAVVEEAATDVIELWLALGEPEPSARPDFIDKILTLQRHREGLARPAAATATILCSSTDRRSALLRSAGSSACRPRRCWPTRSTG